jgi:hypothetical protein
MLPHELSSGDLQPASARRPLVLSAICSLQIDHEGNRIGYELKLAGVIRSAAA